MEESVLMNHCSEPPLPPRYKLRDVILGDHVSAAGSEDEGESVEVEYFTSERSLKGRLQLYFIKNKRSSLRIRIFNFVIKMLTCILYVIRVTLDNPREHSTTCNCLNVCTNHTWAITTAELEHPKIHWGLAAFVNRPFGLWITQIVVASVSLAETLLVTYLGYKGNLLHSLGSPYLLLELTNTVPFIVTIGSRDLRCLFVPVFLNCWLAKEQLQNMFSDLHRALQRSSSALAQKILNVVSTIACLIFTSVCGLQHLQRAGGRHFSLFEAFYFVMVTFSTVGYGDYRPDIWPSQLLMIAMICVAIIVVPAQCEQLASTWLERKRLGGAYSQYRAKTEKHVVVCTTNLHADTVMDFLNEFYAHSKLQDFYVVILSPCDLDPTMRIIMQIPLWAQRIIYIQGSALKDVDLARCRLQEAEACFMLASGTNQDRNAADEHTILRAWAVRDFCPKCPQYVQIFRPENKIHVEFANYVVCQDEYKFAVFANNCIAPGISTFVTLLIHTSRGREGKDSPEEWQRIYGQCSGNEIYHIRLGDSKFFKKYEGKTFTYTSYHVHRRYGVCFIGVRPRGITFNDVNRKSNIQLNPGPRHKMHEDDTCYYLSVTREENSTWISNTDSQEKLGLERVLSITRRGSSRRRSQYKAQTDNEESIDTNNRNLLNLPQTEEPKRKLSLGQISMISQTSLTEDEAGEDDKVSPGIQIQIPNSSKDEDSTDIEGGISHCIKDFPPVCPYIGCNTCICHLVQKKRAVCCLQLAVPCAHCKHRFASSYTWPNRDRTVIVCADHASLGLYNFIVPLRAHCHDLSQIRPIVFLLESRPERIFLEAISYFPLVYWMIGSIDRTDDLIQAGIHFAQNLVVVSKESSNSIKEETLADCNTILVVQSAFRLFPSLRITTGIEQTSNMRFVQFKPNDRYSLSMSKIEKKELEKGSNLSYMFRLPFAAGNVFSASMLDTLLYQAYVKDYLLSIVRLLLGIDQADGSGHLSSFPLTTSKVKWLKNYGRLYQYLCSTSCDIPIGIYRTIKQQIVESDEEVYRRNAEASDVEHAVTCRLLSLDIHDPYRRTSDSDENAIKYVIINPPSELTLKEDDVIYVLKPSSLSDEATPLLEKRVKECGERLTKRSETLIKDENCSENACRVAQTIASLSTNHVCCDYV